MFLHKMVVLFKRIVFILLFELSFILLYIPVQEHRSAQTIF